VYFNSNIETFMSICTHDLESVLSNPNVVPEHIIFQLNEKLKEISSSGTRDIGDM
jgi:hypothetical protein